MNFQEAQRLFNNDRVQDLSQDGDGLRFLKLRSLNRKEHLERLFRIIGVAPGDSSARAMFRQAFECPQVTSRVLSHLIREIYEEERASRRQAEPELVNNLYRLKVFDWGRLHQNSLEKTIVDNYVKKIRSFDSLCEKIDNELHDSMRGYVLNSWYNHWTSIIIEDVFRDHAAVLPAVGQVKKIDFFVHDVPFDLKVTYLPEGFIQERRRHDGHRPELTLLKQSARQHRIPVNGSLADARLLEDLWLKHGDNPAQSAQAVIAELRNYRLALLEECQQNPEVLIRWLYENQGVRRFDASNRLFLVLVDRANFFDSWKLKRAKQLLDNKIRSYLDGVGRSPGRLVRFDWEGTTYSAVSDVVFVVHPNN